MKERGFVLCHSMQTMRKASVGDFKWQIFKSVIFPEGEKVEGSNLSSNVWGMNMVCHPTQKPGCSSTMLHLEPGYRI